MISRAAQQRCLHYAKKFKRSNALFLYYFFCALTLFLELTDMIFYAVKEAFSVWYHIGVMYKIFPFWVLKKNGSKRVE